MESCVVYNGFEARKDSDANCPSKSLSILVSQTSFQDAAWTYGGSQTWAVDGWLWKNTSGQRWDGISTENIQYESEVGGVLQQRRKQAIQAGQLGINEFADQTVQKDKASRNGYVRKRPISGFGLFRYENVSAVPSSIDWRKKGAVTPVKNQEQCGKIYSTKNNYR